VKISIRWKQKRFST